MSKRIYLDYASVTPVDSAVSKEVLRVSKKHTANPSSIYMEGVKAGEFLESCRKRTADFLEVHSDEIIFTSGGTESNALAIKGVIEGYKNSLGSVSAEILGGNSKIDRFSVNFVNGAEIFAEKSEMPNDSHNVPHIISSTIEHPSVKELLLVFEKSGEIELSLISPNEEGIVEAAKIAESLRPNTILVSVMYANNEIGTIMPISTIAKKLREYKKEQGRTEFEMPFLHTDASQAVAYLPMRVPSLHADLLTMDGGKVYGPRGVGALFVKRIVPFKSITEGGSQEKGRRAGTENLPGIAGFALALEMVAKNKDKEAKRVATLRDLLLVNLKSSEIGKRFTINGTMVEGERLPNNLNICIPEIDAEFLVLTLDAMGLCVSSVTSCRTLSEDSYSYVVQEVSGSDCSKSSLRITLGKYTTKGEILRAGKMIVEGLLLNF
ncbi:MAG: cysteine desulfurase family protein [bacterium]